MVAQVLVWFGETQDTTGERSYKMCKHDFLNRKIFK